MNCSACSGSGQTLQKPGSQQRQRKGQTTCKREKEAHCSIHNGLSINTVILQKFIGNAQKFSTEQVLQIPILQMSICEKKKKDPTNIKHIFLAKYFPIFGRGKFLRIIFDC